jgi:hypothetical protein
MEALNEQNKVSLREIALMEKEILKQEMTIHWNAFARFNLQRDYTNPTEPYFIYQMPFDIAFNINQKTRSSINRIFKLKRLPRIFDLKMEIESAYHKELGRIMDCCINSPEDLLTIEYPFIQNKSAEYMQPLYLISRISVTVVRLIRISYKEKQFWRLLASLRHVSKIEFSVNHFMTISLRDVGSAFEEANFEELKINLSWETKEKYTQQQSQNISNFLVVLGRYTRIRERLKAMQTTGFIIPPDFQKQVLDQNGFQKAIFLNGK